MNNMKNGPRGAIFFIALFCCNTYQYQLFKPMSVVCNVLQDSIIQQFTTGKVCAHIQLQLCAMSYKTQ